MADIKRKTANSIKNASYENKLSKLEKSIENWVMEDLKCDKK